MPQCQTCKWVKPSKNWGDLCTSEERTADLCASCVAECSKLNPKGNCAFYFPKEPDQCFSCEWSHCRWSQKTGFGALICGNMDASDANKLLYVKKGPDCIYMNQKNDCQFHLPKNRQIPLDRDKALTLYRHLSGARKVIGGLLGIAEET